MEKERLRNNLLTLLAAYSAATGKSRTAICREGPVNDVTFFKRIADGGSGFNVDTYDRLVVWFSQTWPAGLAWPAEVTRPTAAEIAAASAAVEAAE